MTHALVSRVVTQAHVPLRLAVQKALNTKKKILHLLTTLSLCVTSRDPSQLNVTHSYERTYARTLTNEHIFVSIPTTAVPEHVCDRPTSIPLPSTGRCRRPREIPAWGLSPSVDRRRLRWRSIQGPAQTGVRGLIDSLACSGSTSTARPGQPFNSKSHVCRTVV